ncbi:MAG TPA: glycosyltransferase family 39 protein [Acidobacteriota bacterium]|nr:glycosyltransferase family 39 protein [Acidobacteriota bacterium]
MQETLIDSEIVIPRVRSAKRDRLAEALSKVQFDQLPYGKILIICAIGLSVLMLYLSITNDFHNAHFDSKGHQLVARRIADNLSPGWIQIGAFWLPLPHVLYYPLVKNDWIYFNGFGGILFSVLSYLFSVVLLFRMLKHIVDPTSAFIGTTLYMINTNILYLQTTSLTEGLSIVFSLAAVYFFVRYEVTQVKKWLIIASVISAFGVLIRYENWFTFGMMGLLMILLHIKSKRGFRKILTDGLILGIPNFAAIALTFWINWRTTGSMLVDVSAKFTDWQPGQGSYLLSFFVALYTAGKLISFEWAIATVAAFILMFKRKFRQPAFIASLAIIGPLILYLIQYHDGHPTRIRYGLLLVPACYFFLSHFPERSKLMRYLFLVFALFINTSSYFGKFEASELLEESLRDTTNLSLQSDLLWYLKQHDDGSLILVAMGEIAPVVYDLKLPIKRFIHEGAKPWWNDARKEPEKYAGWVFISQDDKLWKIFHDDPNFHRHFLLIGRRNFLELYKRNSDEQENIKSHRAHGKNLKGEIPVFNKDRKQ